MMESFYRSDWPSFRGIAGARLFFSFQKAALRLYTDSKSAGTKRLVTRTIDGLPTAPRAIVLEKCLRIKSVPYLPSSFQISKRFQCQVCTKVKTSVAAQ